ncbi:hypothetical protein Dip518_000561 [Parelusimicrobium proximum]|uniref:hypothetical protein n=1 Tax=Parelusimicrobium proximum TaxID=3228953 RepID=UPI003D18149D
MKKIVMTAVLSAAAVLCAGALRAHDHAHGHGHERHADINNLLTNVNVAVIGSLITSYTDDSHDKDKYKPAFNLDEVELFLEADITDYAEGTVVLGIHEHSHTHEDGESHEETKVEIEEAYVNIYKNLPVEGLGVKGGKYRAGFGRLNSVHTHALAFIEKPGVISQFLPGGEEGWRDTGLGVYYTLPLHGESKTVLSFDILSGKDFHEDDDSKTHYAYLARINNMFHAGDLPVELGLSWLQSSANIEFGERTYLYGLDAKTTLPLSHALKLVLQGEAFYSDGTAVEYEDNGMLPPNIYFHSDSRYGYYLFANLHIGKRWNAGVIYDEYQRYQDKHNTDRGVKAFGGFNVADGIKIRAAYERQFLESEEDVNTASVQLLFSLGGHKK